VFEQKTLPPVQRRVITTAFVIASLSVFTALVLLLERISCWTRIPQRLCGVGNVAFWEVTGIMQPLREKLMLPCGRRRNLQMLEFLLVDNSSVYEYFDSIFLTGISY